MRTLCIVTLALFAALRALAQQGAPWRQALPSWKYEFPRDHWQHPEFKTEWWYFTGQLKADDGRTFGYQVTFFRQGILPPNSGDPTTSRFIVRNLSFAHAALSEVDSKQFRFGQKLARGSFGETGFGSSTSGGGKITWLDTWRLTIAPSGNFEVTADIDGAELRLRFEAAKPWAIHGIDGISQKAEGAGRASHYYSGTRLKTEGTVVVDGRERSVSGESWFDHEWASNQLTPEQVGWNWFSVQLDDGTELMLYQMRLRQDGIDVHSSGTFINRDGTTIPLARDEYTARPLRYWSSPDSGARYPVEWKIEIPKLDIEISVTTPLDKQELHLNPVAYWEGLINVRGKRGNSSVNGHGYMELTGYAGALVGLSSKDPVAPAPTGK